MAGSSLDPWDVIIFPALETRGVSATILGKSAAGIATPTIEVQPFREANTWRRIPALAWTASKAHGFAIDRRINALPSPFGLDDAIPGLARTLAGYDAVLAFETYRASTCQACRAHRNVVVKVCENIPHNPPQLPFSRFRASVLRHAAAFLCVSESARQALVIEGVDPGRTVVIPEPVDTQIFHPAYRPVSRNPFTIGFASALDIRHGILDLVDAFTRLAKDLNVFLRIAGLGPLKPTVLSTLEQRNLQGRFECLGAVPHAEMPAFLRSLDVLCVPSRESPGWKSQFGIVNIEAMACGVPVVTTRSGANPEVVTPRLRSLLVVPGDTDALESSLRKLASSPEFAKELGNEAREWTISRYDVNLVANRWSALFASVIEGRTPAIPEER